MTVHYFKAVIIIDNHVDGNEKTKQKKKHKTVTGCISQVLLIQLSNDLARVKHLKIPVIEKQCRSRVFSAERESTVQ